MNPLLFVICILTITIATESPDTGWVSTVLMHHTDKEKSLQPERPCNLSITTDRQMWGNKETMRQY